MKIDGTNLRVGGDFSFFAFGLESIELQQFDEFYLRDVNFQYFSICQFERSCNVHFIHCRWTAINPSECISETCAGCLLSSSSLHRPDVEIGEQSRHCIQSRKRRTTVITYHIYDNTKSTIPPWDSSSDVLHCRQSCSAIQSNSNRTLTNKVWPMKRIKQNAMILIISKWFAVEREKNMFKFLIWSLNITPLSISIQTIDDRSRSASMW